MTSNTNTKIRINNELPLCMLFGGKGDGNKNKDYNLKYNDYDFVLFHLYSPGDGDNNEYRDYYKNKIRSKYLTRPMILDNSAYEFYVKGEVLDLEKFKDAIIDLQPNYYILPDTLMNFDKTINDTIRFLEDYYDEINEKTSGISKPMAVVQGNSQKEFEYALEIYDELQSYKEFGEIALCFPFHNSFYVDEMCEGNLGEGIFNLTEFINQPQFNGIFDNMTQNEAGVKDLKYMIGRYLFITKHSNQIKQKFNYVHLLGSHNPLEIILYESTHKKQGNNIIDSIDTGYPVKLGYINTLLGTETHKPDVLIDDFYHLELDDQTKKIIEKNMIKMRNINIT